MNILSSIFLGIVQGLTEFLPVSSSGHLVITQKLIPNFNQPGVLFDVFLHAGTLLAVLMYFYKDILKLTYRNYFYLGLATMPAALIGLLFSDSIELLFVSTKLVGGALIITALLNFMTNRNIKNKSLDFSCLTNPIKTSLFVGMFQAIAIIPGISRSGSTIFAGTKHGLSAKEAAKFSFLLSIPAIVGANILQFAKYSDYANVNPINYLAGFISALISGYFAIILIIKLLEGKKFIYFSYYCLILGLTVIIFL